jgi:hypothetical protein
MPITAQIRDWAIIILAVESIVIGIALIALAIQMYSLIRLVRDEIKPMLESTNETANTVRGTTLFVSETVVSPVVNILSYFSALRGIVRALIGRRSG